MAETDDDAKTGTNWRLWFKQMAVVIAYIALLKWMESGAAYPDSFGVRLTGSGRAEVFEEWWYSYLLLQRPNALDVFLFCYFWLPIVGLFGWPIYLALRRRGFTFKFYDDDQPPQGGS